MLYFVLGVVAIILYFKMRKYKKTAEELSIFQNKLEEMIHVLAEVVKNIKNVVEEINR